MAAAGPTLRLEPLVALLHHRWSVPVLAFLSRSRVGTRFVVLANDLSISRDVLRNTLAALVERGLIMKNPGYGHPLRPEYVLTARGTKVAPACQQLHANITRAGLNELAYRKWTLPLILAVELGATRFSELEAALSGITPRALTRALRQSAEGNLVLRRVDDGYPPRTSYRTSRGGARLATSAERVASLLTPTRPD